MKTNKLMTAVALSAMFAACTQDAELNETLAKNDFSNIPMVEADFTAETGVDSRMATKFDWEEGDLIGLVWGGPNGDGQAWANYPLKCINPSAKAFKGESMYYVGKYFGYLPYSETTTSLAFIPFSIKEQPLTTDPNDLSNKVIYITPHTIELTADNAGRGKNFALTMAQLTNCATINLTFKNATADLKIKKVELDIQDEQFKSMIPVEFTYNPADEVETDTWADVSNAKFCAKYMKTATQGVVTLADEDGLALNSDGKLTVYAVTMPGFSVQTFKKVSIKVTTTMGTVEVFDAKVLNDEGEAEAITATTPLVSELGQQAKIEATIDMKNAIGIDRVAADQDELNTIIANWIAMGKADYQLEVVLNPTTANDDKTFELTDFETPEGLNKALILKVGDRAETIVFNGTTTIGHNINVVSPAEVNGTMTVEEDVVWQGAGADVTLTINNDAKLINNGTLGTYVKTVAATDDKAAGKYVHNGEKAAVTVKIDNQGEAQWVLGADYEHFLVDTKAGYAEATDLDDLKTIAGTNGMVQLVHLVDGAVIENNTENYNFNTICVVECYGNVKFNITDTPSGVEKGIVFGDAKTLIATSGSNVTVTSDNQSNLLGLTAITVEQGASLDVDNVTLPAEITNKGSVVLKDVKKFKKGDQAQGSYWEESTTPAE